MEEKYQDEFEEFLKALENGEVTAEYDGKEISEAVCPANGSGKGDNNEENNSIVSLLQEIQKEHHYLPADVLKEVAEKRNIPLMDIYSVATFYKSFSLEPVGKHKIVCCSGTACHVRGGKKITGEISRLLKIKPGETSKDRLFSLETVSCLGACALAPLVVVDGEYCGNMATSRIESFLEERLPLQKE